MKVQELIELLQELSEDEKQLPVEVEGCDCTAAATGVRVDRFELLDEQTGEPSGFFEDWACLITR